MGTQLCKYADSHEIICKFTLTLMEISRVFVDPDRVCPKSIWKSKGAKIFKAILKKNKKKGFVSPDIETYKTTVMEII